MIVAKGTLLAKKPEKAAKCSLKGMLFSKPYQEFLVTKSFNKKKSFQTLLQKNFCMQPPFARKSFDMLAFVALHYISYAFR